MARLWSRQIGVTDLDGPSYWVYFGAKLVEYADIPQGASVLDVGCGGGSSSLFSSAEKTGSTGYAVGIDICPCQH
jgi:ubiquinone/menaquinone biosynthesis C-methylase UbiE